MKRFFNTRLRVLSCAAAIAAVGAFQFSGIMVGATNVAQTLPFTQNWSNTAAISTDNSWSGVAGVVGYRGDDLITLTGVDPRTVLADGSATPVSVLANQTSPDTFNTGGVAEFEIANPVVALNGSGTADAPHIVFYLNTTGQSNVTFAGNVRDIDASVDNSTQQVDFQYRIGGTGSYTSIPGGYIADASAGPSLTLTTPVSIVLPAAANNQALVEVRMITTNAVGNDEWVGIDDVSVTGTPVSAAAAQHIVDFNGDGKTDWAVLRNTGGGPGGQITWFTQFTGTGTSTQFPWGSSGDFFTPGDYDGDNKTDYSVWRAGAAGTAAWYTLQSSTGTVRAEIFGQTGDDPSVLGDYDGDGKDDIAVYRAGATSGAASTWYWRTSLNGGVFSTQWGQNGDFPAPGDYDGDGKNDLVIQRNAGGGAARFWTLSSTGVVSSTVFGTPTDVIVPGDYDGDGKTDLATVRGQAGQYHWYVQPSSGGAFTDTIWGASATDFVTQGDYDGDGKTDVAVWRPNADPSQTNFYVFGSTAGFIAFHFGQNGDAAVANYNRH